MTLSSTISYADIYGPRTPRGDATPPSMTEKASGANGLPGPEKGPAFTWLILLGMLVAMRLVYEKLPAGGKL